MKISTEKLLTELTQYVNEHLEYGNSLKDESATSLNQRSNENSWSALECLEHLNLYGAFYIPEIQKRMKNSSLPKTEIFKSGYWGNKFALDMLPRDGMKTMNTFKSKNPIYSQLDKDKVIDTFIQQQKEFLELLKVAENKNLIKIKTSLTIPILTFRLGDTFRFVIYHNERHVVQAKKAMS